MSIAALQRVQGTRQYTDITVLVAVDARLKLEVISKNVIVSCTFSVF